MFPSPGAPLLGLSLPTGPSVPIGWPSACQMIVLDSSAVMSEYQTWEWVWLPSVISAETQAPLLSPLPGPRSRTAELVLTEFRSHWVRSCLHRQLSFRDTPTSHGSVWQGTGLRLSLGRSSGSECEFNCQGWGEIAGEVRLGDGSRGSWWDGGGIADMKV